MDGRNYRNHEGCSRCRQGASAAPTSWYIILIASISTYILCFNILRCFSDRPIVFEVFDQNGVTTDVGRFVKRERSRRRGGRESGANSQGTPEMWFSFHYTDNYPSPKIVRTTTRSRMKMRTVVLTKIALLLLNLLSKRFTAFSGNYIVSDQHKWILECSSLQLIGNANLDSSFVKDEWNDLPRLLARRKLYMVGLPAICAPYVIDDEVEIYRLLKLISY